MSAILPGTGYFYCGEWREGSSALLINGLFAASIYSLFKNENVGSGILVTLIAMPFYFGNISGTVSSAYNYNNHEQMIFNKNLMQTLKLDFYFSKDFLMKCWDGLYKTESEYHTESE